MAVETTYTHARANFKALLDEAADSREPVIIHRRGGDDVAIIAADELRSLLETAHLLDRRKTPNGCSELSSGPLPRKLRPRSIDDSGKTSVWITSSRRWFPARIVLRCFIRSSGKTFDTG